MSTFSLQKRFSPNSICFGCGPANQQGLRIESVVAPDDSVVATWVAQSHHQAFPGILNGGIIGALLDCHSNWAAAYYLMKRSGAEAPPCTVTAEFSVQLRRPTPVDRPVQLVAKAVEVLEDRARIHAELWANDKLCDTCTGLFVAVKPGHPAYHRW